MKSCPIRYLEKLPYYDKLADSFETTYDGRREEARVRISRMCRKNMHL